MAEPVRVLQMIDGLGRAGGAERSLAILAPHLQAEGVDLHVAYLVERGGLRSDLEKHGVHVHSLADSGGGRAEWRRRTIDLIDEVHPDVVHTTLFEADLAGRRAAAARGIPCVSSLVNTSYSPAEAGVGGTHRLKRRAAQAVDVLTARHVTRFHAVTDHVASVMSRRLLVSPRRIVVIPRGRDPEHLGVRSPARRAEVRRALGIAEDTSVVLAVGRHEPQKGFDVLLHAAATVMKDVPDVRFLFAGREGRATAGMRAVLAEHGIEDRVDLLGMRDDVPDLMVAADALALSSRWEGAAGTLLEAMALECPIVSSALPTLEQTVDASTALLVPPGEAAPLAEALVAVLQDRDAARARALRAREVFWDRFTIGSSARGMAALYRSVAAR